MDRYTSFSEFWPFYVREHSRPATRQFHFVGSFLVIVVLVLGVVSSPMFFIIAPICGYGFAWVSHFFVEKNKPATFTYPLWSLIADYKMFYLMCLGRMDKEVKLHVPDL